jgi:hypothetical protein
MAGFATAILPGQEALFTIRSQSTITGTQWIQAELRQGSGGLTIVAV